MLAELLEAFDNGCYWIDEQRGQIISAKTKKPLFVYNHKWPPDPNELGHWFVRLYYKGKYICTSKARIIWMVKNRREIPEGFEIHHDNENSEDDTFENLICIYGGDHKKLHRKHNGHSAEVPF